MRKHLPQGRLLALAVIAAVGIGQWNSLIGILGITSNVIFEILAINFPGLQNHQYGIVLGIAVVVIGVFYLLLVRGNYSLFEKVLALFVSLMGFSFVFTLLFVFPQPAEIIRGLVPKIPDVKGAGILLAAFVGTTMAAATFLSRPLFIQGKGWTRRRFPGSAERFHHCGPAHLHHQWVHYGGGEWQPVRKWARDHPGAGYVRCAGAVRR